MHKDKEYDAPADLFFDFKAGSFGLSNNRFNLGTLFSLRLPTGETHNYPFQAYSAGAVEFGVTGLASFFNDPFLPHRDLSFHLNTGWYYHNDAGKTLVSQAFTTSTGVDSTRELTAGYGLGFSYPTELFDLNLEIWGNKFISKPDSLALSREDYTYFTPSILFKPKWWVNFNFALDLRVYANTDETDPRYTFSGGNLDLPNYASWFMHMGMNFVLNPGDSRIRGGISERADLKKKVDFYERLLKEREKTRSIEEELRRLKREREQAEKELEELRQLLEEEG